jgi:hypothetical protein
MAFRTYAGYRLEELYQRPSDRADRAWHQSEAEVMRDTGCSDISESCLDCPLPQCLFDYPPQARAAVKAQFLAGEDGIR